ncbi:Plant cadmium resistance 2 [Quillaja saponaria]|uniref:Plant cadmium resistance 2 n=1 Tax=Quillaja saponaria TaxID=32244 RepID=A0AAD7L7D2_QUISA|nr:Plant cadmium resistance 2 [Quillaja saponaria]
MNTVSNDGNGKYAAQVYEGVMNAYPRQPYPSPYNSKATRWSTQLCHCCDDPGNCFVTCFCPCITFGQIAEIVNKGAISCAASGAIYGVLLGLTGLPCLELKNRGFDMGIGWQANMDRQSRGIMLAPACTHALINRVALLVLMLLPIKIERTI